jgi:predicted acyltransferase (DUF342 family)
MSKTQIAVRERDALCIGENILRYLLRIFSRDIANHHSIIRDDVEIQGDVFSTRDIYLLGNVTGNVTCNQIFIDECGSVGGVVKAFSDRSGSSPQGMK